MGKFPEGAMSVSMYYLLVPWVLLAGLVGWIAAKRGRSAFTWAFLSLIFSPSVLALLVAMPQRALAHSMPGRPAPARRATAQRLRA
jgi:hypothetical protein